jgi:murein DD-endopeptidase MepM/ murein hydrolase activator NlpD
MCLFVLPWVPHYTMAARVSPELPARGQQPSFPEEAAGINAVHAPAAEPPALAVDGPTSIPVRPAAMPAQVQAEALTPPVVAPHGARQPQELATPSDMTFSDTVRKGDTAIVILERAGVDTPQAMALYRDVRNVYDLRRINVGQAYHVHMDAEGHIQQFTYEIDHRQWLRAKRNGQGFSGRLNVIPYARNERLVVGELSESIYATLKAQGESPRLIHDFADIFAWTVDFATDLRQGDPFRLLIEEHVRKGQPAEYHRILAAELINRDRKLQAIYYHHNDVGGYYQPDGSSMQGMFLRSPLRYTRISSRFTRRRFHPILKRYLPHLGVDYVAPRGTPVRSVADGAVVWVGRKGASGNMIVIGHHNAYQSYYLHLSRYAPGLRRMKRVTQGQIIGYVGSTGMSTGPHLDFRLTKNDKFINPLKHRSMEAPAVPKRAMAGFRKHAQIMLDKLQQVQLAMQQEAKSESPNKAE